MSNLTYYQRNGDVILNRAKYYYENDKERLRDQQIPQYVWRKKTKTKRISKRLSRG